MLDKQALWEKLLDFLQSPPSTPDYLGEEPATTDFDPYQMVGEWIALRHEIKQQGKLWQATQGTLAQALEQLEKEKAQWEQRLEDSQKQTLAQGEKEEKALLRELLGILDAIERACSHGQEQLRASELPAAHPQPRPFWQGWFKCLRRKVANNTSTPWQEILAGQQEGIALIGRSLVDILRQRQVIGVETEGRPFDPQKMYAIGRQENASVPENTVVQEVVKGYLWKGQVLREAQVIVSSKKQ